MRILRIALIITFVAITLQETNAQDQIFAHSLGFEYNSYLNASSLGVLYSPRIALIHTGKQSNISVGSHLGAGFAWHGLYPNKTYYIQAPVVFEYNFGQGSEPNTRAEIGGFVGLGYGFNFNGSEKAWGTDTYNVNGIVATFGLRRVIKNIPLGFRMQYLFDLKNSDYGIWGIGFYYFFGDFK